MNDAHLYRLSIAVCGAALGIVGLSSIASGATDVVTVLLAISGTGMVFGVTYEAVTSDAPSRSTPDRRIVWITTLCAVVVLGTAAWATVT